MHGQINNPIWSQIGQPWLSCVHYLIAILLPVRAPESWYYTHMFTGYSTVDYMRNSKALCTRLALEKK